MRREVDDERAPVERGLKEEPVELGVDRLVPQGVVSDGATVEVLLELEDLVDPSLHSFAPTLGEAAHAQAQRRVRVAVPDGSLGRLGGAGEDRAVLDAHEERRRRPFSGNLVAAGDGEAALHDRGVERIPVRERGVERLAESGGGLVGDRELHRDHRRHAGENHGRRQGRVEVLAVLSRHLGAEAGAEDDQPQGADALHELREHIAGEVVDPAVSPFAEKEPLARFGVESAVPYEMEHVDVVVAQPAPDFGDLSLLEQVDVDVRVSLERVGDEPRLGGEIVVAVALRGRGDEEHAQRTLETARSDRPVGLVIPDDRGREVPAEEVPRLGLVEQLPGQCGEVDVLVLGGVKVQADPQPDTLERLDAGQALLETGRDLPLEEAVEKLGPELPLLLGQLLGGASLSLFEAQERGVEVGKAPFGLLGREGQSPHVLARAERRVEDPGDVATAGRHFKLEDEVLVLHRRLPCRAGCACRFSHGLSPAEMSR
jgi:hypothetical protein